jgi:hypothetical protein
MSANQGLFPYASNRGKAVHVSEFRFTITGTNTVTPLPIDDASCLEGQAAGAFTQAIIDAHLGTSSEFTAAQFDATSMGADAQGIIINMAGQVDELLMFEGICYSATGGATQSMVADIDTATLTDSSLQTECALGANGNVGVKVDWGNSPDFDGLTAGQIIIRIHWRAK